MWGLQDVRRWLTWHNAQELVVDQSLVDELERLGVHGVHVGDRVRLQLIHGHAHGSSEELPAFFGSFASGEPDLAERVDEILGAELRAQ